MYFVIVSTALALFLFQPAYCHNFSSVEQQFQHHINFLKEVLPRRKTLELNHANSLVSISHEGVPVNFDGARLDIGLPPLADTNNPMLNQSKTINQNILTSSMPFETGSLIHKIMTYSHPLVSKTQHSRVASGAESIKVSTAVSSELIYLSSPPSTPTLEFDTLSEIRRLESLLADLREQMNRQEVSFRKKMARGSEGPTVVTSLEMLPQSVHKSISGMSVASIIENEYISDSGISKSKINGRQIMTRKNLPNSVMVMPQFQHHTRSKIQSDLPYHKPKIVWAEHPTSTATSVIETDSVEMLGVLREGEYTILFDKYHQIGYFDANAIQFTEVTNVPSVPSITQYEEYFPKSTSEYYDGKYSLGDVSSDNESEQLFDVEYPRSDQRLRSPLYDQDLIHSPPKKVDTAADVSQSGLSAGKGVSSSRDRRARMHTTKSFNFDVFDFESKLNSASAVHGSLNFIRYILLLILH
ncbi:Pga27 GPI-anchored protein [Candida orthopsilosis Co 90-125]|uniref:Pga27 GPI-anchored protein n=1 Tax=Candida orthopsilosis (strain 90-125) TaxID=1136231 RepID=H8WYY3_CANO9|nr:Pga27 GPI-anchored protein [Candida orthopsilosis Co 90-125]CCG21615.1 Pga27 GPI-anchored protein [Candida orthopsilosis Co 90-125]